MEQKYYNKYCRITIVRGLGKNRIVKKYEGVIQDFCRLGIRIKRQRPEVKHKAMEEIWVSRLYGSDKIEILE